MVASLIRLHFHDCFVQGCDASILLEDSSSFTGEQTAVQNNNSIRGYEVIKQTKYKLERICPGVVSCADILAVAARDASVAVGGPSWTVKLGRRDSTKAKRSRAVPRFRDSLETFISLFGSKGLNARDMVALSGSHTIGKARCVTFRERIYNASNINSNFARIRKHRCPANGGDTKLAPLDLVTPNSFDKNLIRKKGILASDQIFFSGGSTDSIVIEYKSNRATFRSDFASAMVKMGNIHSITGSRGQMRRICSAVNSN